MKKREEKKGAGAVMVTKEELVRMLGEAMDFEERSMPLLQEKCLACFEEIQKSGVMIEEDKRKMIRMLRLLVSGAKEHRKELEMIILDVGARNQNEY